MNSFAAAVCLLAASASAWTLDLRNNYEDSHTIYLKAGEPIDVLLDGQTGTGFTWINELEWQQRLSEEDDIDDSSEDEDNKAENPASDNHIIFVKSQKIEDDHLGYQAERFESFRSMGHKQNYRHSFKTTKGKDFDEMIKFVYAREWMLKEFPQNRSEASGHFSTISVVAKQSFAHDFSSDDFDLVALPNKLTVKKGDLIRLILRENPTTGYWWHTNARRELDAPLREVYNGFEAPDSGLIGASGKRILVF